MVPAVQTELVAFLSRLTGAPPTETAGSFVFAGAAEVVKLRKAIERPLADFTPRRRRLCAARRDLAVAAQGAPGLYLGMKAVLRSPTGELSLTAHVAQDDPAAIDSAAIDWVLHLGRVPAAEFAAAMVGGDTLDGRQMDLIADAVVALHQRLAPLAVATPPGASLETLRLLALEITRVALQAKLPQPPVMRWVEATLARLEALSALLDRRAAAGLVRPGHGNLHLGNVCRWRHDWVLVDTALPDPAIGVPDLGWDLAPLLVELEARVGRMAANRLLSRYIARTGDTLLLPLLPLLMSLRAMLFAADLAARDADTAAGFFRLAGLYHGTAKPVVVAIGGLPGVGKSTLARALAPGLGVGPGAVVLRADDIRKRLLGLAPEMPARPAADDPALAGQVIAALAAQLREAASAGHAVVADAGFLHPADRATVQQAAAAAGAPFVGIWLDAPLPALQTRLAGRAFDASDASAESLRAANLINPGALDWQRVDAGEQAASLAAAQRLVGTATAAAST